MLGVATGLFEAKGCRTFSLAFGKNAILVVDVFTVCDLVESACIRVFGNLLVGMLCLFTGDQPVRQNSTVRISSRSRISSSCLVVGNGKSCNSVHSGWNWTLEDIALVAR